MKAVTIVISFLPSGTECEVKVPGSPEEGFSNYSFHGIIRDDTPRMMPAPELGAVLGYPGLTVKKPPHCDEVAWKIVKFLSGIMDDCFWVKFTAPRENKRSDAIWEAIDKRLKEPPSQGLFIKAAASILGEQKSLAALYKFSIREGC